MRWAEIWAGMFGKVGHLKKCRKSKAKIEVVPMGLPGGQNVATPRESLLALSRGSRLPYRAKFKK